MLLSYMAIQLPVKYNIHFQVFFNLMRSVGSAFCWLLVYTLIKAAVRCGIGTHTSFIISSDFVKTCVDSMSTLHPIIWHVRVRNRAEQPVSLMRTSPHLCQDTDSKTGGVYSSNGELGAFVCVLKTWI